MKKKLIILLALFLPISVEAAGKASISASSSVEVGSSVTATVTLQNTAAWNIKIISAGSTSGCSQSFADATTTGQNTTKKLSVTCKATSVGAISFTVSGDITSADGANSNVSLSKRVTVTEVRPKSTDASLQSLGIDGYELTPVFDKDKLEYTATLPSTVNKINITAKANESHANVEGIGEFEVTEGINTFNVVVTAENGAQQTYVINVNVEDTNPVEIKIGNKKYTLVKNAKNITKPEFYDEKTLKINNFDIPAFYSSVTKFTLVGVKDEVGKISFAIYDEKAKTYTLYNETLSNALSLYIVDFPEVLEGYIKTTIKINEQEVSVYELSDNSRFVICYAMNLTTGKYDYYSYDTKERTFQIYNKEEIETLKKEAQTYLYVSLGFGAGLFLSFITIISLLYSKKKRLKKVKNAIHAEEVKKDIETEKVIEDNETVEKMRKEMKKNAKKK